MVTKSLKKGYKIITTFRSKALARTTRGLKNKLGGAVARPDARAQKWKIENGGAEEWLVASTSSRVFGPCRQWMMILPIDLVFSCGHVYVERLKA
jgi:hypothetical protein